MRRVKFPFAEAHYETIQATLPSCLNCYHRFDAKRLRPIAQGAGASSGAGGSAAVGSGAAAVGGGNSLANPPGAGSMTNPAVPGAPSDPSPADGPIAGTGPGGTSSAGLPRDSASTTDSGAGDNRDSVPGSSASSVAGSFPNTSSATP